MKTPSPATWLQAGTSFQHLSWIYLLEGPLSQNRKLRSACSHLVGSKGQSTPGWTARSVLSLQSWCGALNWFCAEVDENCSLNYSWEVLSGNQHTLWSLSNWTGMLLEQDSWFHFIGRVQFSPSEPALRPEPAHGNWRRSPEDAPNTRAGCEPARWC